MSKQVPLLISINLATEKETEAALRAQNSKHPQISPEFLNALTEEEKYQLEFKTSPREKQRKYPESAQLIMEENKEIAEQGIRKKQKNQEEERVVKKFLFKSGDDLR